MSAESRPHPPPAFAGRFTRREQLGRGSMGVVYRAHDHEMGVDVALKTLMAPDPEHLYWLKQEFRALTGIVHPNLVELYELCVVDDEAFFTMEIVPGVPFCNALRSADGLPPEARWSDAAMRRLIGATRQLVEGLATVHRAGRLHRDIKPSNVLVTGEGRVVVLDFGLATALAISDGFDSQSGLIVGTLAYMAPEQGWGRPPAPAADWYSVGVMLYEVITGRLPFEGPPAQLLRDKETRPPPRPAAVEPDIPPWLDALVVDLLSPDPQVRPGAEAILAQLRDSSDLAPLLEPTARVERDTTFVGRRAELAILQERRRQLASGRPVVVHVRGVSGIGKTELVRQFLAHAEEDDVAITLYGRCNPQEQVPYKALDGLVDRLSRVLSALPETRVDALMPRHVADLIRIFPVLARVPTFAPWAATDDPAEPREIRRRGFGALRELLARIADRRQLILWIDDLQWGDSDSAALLRELLRPPDAPAILLILSYRTEGAAALTIADSLAADGETTGVGHDVITLGPLTEPDSRALATQLGAESLAATIAIEAGGSPFIVTQLASHLPGPAAAPAPGQGLARLLSDRLTQLPETARDLLEVIAVAGRPVDRGIALAAAGTTERNRPLLWSLEQRNLLRSTSLFGGVAVEVYHDRIREMLLESLAPSRLRQCHLLLAQSLLGQPTSDAEALFRHFLGADQRDEAARWAAVAADRSAEALAFAEAAELYRRALELTTWEAERGAELQSRRAHALVNAGLGAEAAPLFAAASERQQGLPAIELRRNAAQHYLASGQMDAGVTMMRALLTDLGMRYPRSNVTAFAGAAVWIMRLLLRPPGPPEAVSDANSSRWLAVADACDAAAKGLLFVDPVRGGYFAMRGVVLAMRTGDPRRMSRSYALAAGSLIPAGGLFARLGLRLLDAARALADRHDDPYLRAVAVLTAGQARLLEGRWREMLRCCDDARALLVARCRGVRWELDVAQMGALRALEELGRLDDVVARAETFLRESRDTGDVYGEVTARLYLALCYLAADDPDATRREARAGLERWTQRAFNMQHFYAARAEAFADLYERNPASAWQRVTAAWPDIRRANLLRHALLRCDAYVMRARCAIAFAAANGDPRERLLTRAERDARLLAAEPSAAARAHALLLRAGAAAVRGDSQVNALLADAERAFTQADMALFAAVTAALRTGSHDAVPTALGNRDRWLALCAPGLAR